MHRCESAQESFKAKFAAVLVVIQAARHAKRSSRRKRTPPVHTLYNLDRVSHKQKTTQERERERELLLAKSIMEEPLLSQDPEKGRTLSFSSASSSSSGASSSSSLSKNNKNNKMPNTNKPKLLFTTGVRYSKQLLTFVGICFLFYGICHIYSMSNLSELKRQQYEIIARNNYLYGYNGIKNEKEGYHTNLSYHEESYLTIIQTIQDMENVNTKFLYCTITFLVVLFVFAVPKKLYVYSNPPTLVIETHCGIQYKFENIASAKRNSNQCDSFRRIRSDFSTDLQNRVYIKRRSSSSSGNTTGSSKWSLWKDREIACSPMDPDGFLQAIEDANSMSSDSNDNCNIDT